MEQIRRYRRIEFTITASTHAVLFGRRYTFNADGCVVSGTDTIAPQWLYDSMVSYAVSAPEISGTEKKDLICPENPSEKVTVWIERYIDLKLSSLIEIQAKEHPWNEAVVDITNGVRLTYSEMNRECDIIAKHLIDFGVHKYDTAAVIMKNSSMQIVAKYGIIKSGAIAVNISPYEKLDSLRELLLQTDVKVLFVKADNLIDMLYQICPELRESACGKLHAAALPKLRAVISFNEKKYPGIFSYKDFMNQPLSCTDDELNERKNSVSCHDIATIIHTSGTTGTPKGVMLKHSALIENIDQHVRMLKITSEDRILVPVPMFHTLGAIGAAGTALAAGATIICMHKPVPSLVLKAFADERCTVFMSVPNFYITLFDEAECEHFDTAQINMHSCVMAGAECSEKVIMDTYRIFHADNVLVMYGMTEAGPGISSTCMEDSVEIKKSTVGKPWAGTKVRLADTYLNDEGQTCGEICAYGYNVMSGYYKDRAATEKVIDADGWLHTGDVGRIREDGNIVLCGRTKDIIIRNGENISPREIEKLLLSYRGVSDAVAVGAKDFRTGEVIIAFLRAEPDCTVSEADMLDFCKDKISKLKIPERVIVLDDFPRSGTGKILRGELRKMAQQIHEEDLKRSEKEKQS